MYSLFTAKAVWKFIY